MTEENYDTVTVRVEKRVCDSCGHIAATLDGIGENCVVCREGEYTKKLAGDHAEMPVLAVAKETFEEREGVVEIIE